EIAGRLPEHEVAAFVRFPSLDDRQIGPDPALENIGLAVEILMFLALGNDGPDPGLRIEAGDPGAAGPATLGKRALRAEFDFQLPGQELTFELLVLPDIRGNHLLHLARAQELAQALIV